MTQLNHDIIRKVFLQLPLHEQEYKLNYLVCECVQLMNGPVLLLKLMISKRRPAKLWLMKSRAASVPDLSLFKQDSVHLLDVDWSDFALYVFCSVIVWYSCHQLVQTYHRVCMCCFQLKLW